MRTALEAAADEAHRRRRLVRRATFIAVGSLALGALGAVAGVR